ncbi:MAG: hypothetical protein MZV49_23740 [Rhodopseudomonas palustris]|nr:hypothetical protein [Rhodopseudomonas palustris]
MAASLQREGFDPMFGSGLEEAFRAAGYGIVEAGEVNPLWEPPDSEFLKLQLGAASEPFPERISVPVFWGVFRVLGNRG